MVHEEKLKEKNSQKVESSDDDRDENLAIDPHQINCYEIKARKLPPEKHRVEYNFRYLS